MSSFIPWAIALLAALVAAWSIGYRWQNIAAVAMPTTSRRRTRGAHKSMLGKIGHVLGSYLATPFVYLRTMTYVLLALVPGMWIINIAGFEKVNYFFFLGAIPLMALLVFRWQWFATALGLGAFVAWLASTDEKKFDLSRGALTGVEVLAKIALGVLVAFWFVAGVLSAISWQQSPAAFWGVLGFILLLVSYFQLRGIKMMLFRDLIVTVFGLFVIGRLLWTTVPALWEGRVFDQHTGAPIIMMESDGSRVYRDVLAKDCVEVKCYSPYTGEELKPIDKETAKRHGLQGWINSAQVASAKAKSDTKTPSKGVEAASKQSGGVTVLEKIEVVVPKDGRTRSWPNRTQGTCLLPVYPSGLEELPTQIVHHPMYDWHPLEEMAKLQGQANPAWSDVYFVGNGKVEVRMHLERRKADQCT